MKLTRISLILCVALGMFAQPLWADSTHVIADPPIAFSVNDSAPFDGTGDSGPYVYDMVVVGTVGEKRAMIEFDLSTYTVPENEVISSVIYDVYVFSVVAGGMGCPMGTLPESIAVDGYVGNGVKELSDFSAGNGNFVTGLDLISPEAGDILSFDVTDYMTSMIGANVPWVGLTLRSETLGAIAIVDPPIVGYPRLTINTVTVPEPSALVLLGLAGLAAVRRR